MSNKIVTDDCISSFISKHYGKTSISGIGDGTVTGAISTLNSNFSGEWIKLTVASDYEIEGCCIKFGKIVVVGITLCAAKSNTLLLPENNWTYVSGFPPAADYVKVTGTHLLTTSESSRNQTLSCILNESGVLQSWYPTNQYINRSSGVGFNFAYRCK